MVMQKKEKSVFGSRKKKVICLLVMYKDGREPYLSILFSDLRPPWSLHLTAEAGDPVAEVILLIPLL